MESNTEELLTASNQYDHHQDEYSLLLTGLNRVQDATNQARAAVTNAKRTCKTLEAKYGT